MVLKLKVRKGFRLAANVPMSSCELVAIFTFLLLRIFDLFNSTFLRDHCMNIIFGGVEHICFVQVPRFICYSIETAESANKRALHGRDEVEVPYLVSGIRV